MEIKEHCTNLLLSYDPNFLILDVKRGNEYIFYNSIRHLGCRISKLELLLLELLYKYEDIEYISSKFPVGRQAIIEETLQRVIDEQLLSIIPLEEPTPTEQQNQYPQAYYLHLTYKCNLACTYCYNKKIRSNKEELELNEWKILINKIAPFAKNIVLTGGECFMYHDFIPLLKYIKKAITNVHIACISNCMHNFVDKEFDEAFEYIDNITFSCDSIEKEGERKGFNPELFRKNIAYLKNSKPNLKIGISATNTAKNTCDIHKIKDFSEKMNCDIMNITLIPSVLDDIELMAPISEYLYDNTGTENISPDNYIQFPRSRTGCGAAKNVCSIDSKGNVYPCQSLHYKHFFMGNLLEQEISELRYLNNKEKCLPSVNDILTCSKCKVKYICGGGCMATAYELNKTTIGRDKLICPYNYHLAMMTLEKIKNNPFKS